MLLILAAARRAGEGERLVRAGRLGGLGADAIAGDRRGRKRLGIFGMGRIGRELARMARGFGMQMHYRDMARLPAELEAGAIFHDSDASFLPVCEVLSLHAPGGGATRHWLNATRIAQLPRGAVVANAARGTLVDDAALIAALRTGQVGRAGLDVYEGEPRVHPGLSRAGERGAAAASRQRHGGDARCDGLAGAGRHRRGAGRAHTEQSGQVIMRKFHVGRSGGRRLVIPISKIDG